MNSIEEKIAQHKADIARLEADLSDLRPDYPVPAHYRVGTSVQPPSRTAFYRDKANGKFFGVCAGIADYTGIDVLWVRLAMLVSIFLTSGVSLILYVAVVLLTSGRPQGLYENPADQKFWQGVRQNSSRTAKDVRSKLRDIDRRIAAIEADYVDHNRRLADEIDALK